MRIGVLRGPAKTNESELSTWRERVRRRVVGFVKL